MLSVLRICKSSTNWILSNNARIEQSVGCEWEATNCNIQNYLSFLTMGLHLARSKVKAYSLPLTIKDASSDLSTGECGAASSRQYADNKGLTDSAGIVRNV